MPYAIVQRNSEHCVINKDTGETVPGGCHASASKANRHLRALYANVEDASKEFKDLLKEWVETGEDVAVISKEDDTYVIETISTAALPDREDETFSIEAMDYDIRVAKETGEYPQYRVFHSPLAYFGIVKEMKRIGIFAYERGESYDDPFSIAVCEKMLANNTDGKWRVSRGFRVEEVTGLCPECRSTISVRRKHMIAGFRCPTCRSVHLNYRGILGDVQFKQARTFDITVTDVPSNPYTSASAFRLSEFSEDNNMDKKALKERLLAAGLPEDTVEERLESISDERLKELGDDIPDAVLLKEFQDDEPMPDADHDDDDVVMDWRTMRNDLTTSMTAAFKDLLNGFEFEVGDLDMEVVVKELPEIVELKEHMAEIEAKLDELLLSDEERLKELMDGAPRQAHNRLRIQRYKEGAGTPAAEDDEEEDEEDVVAKLQKELANMGSDAVIQDADGNVYGSMTEFVRAR